jgi:pimeloyl-ACP methyl ester carboxylesterase
MMITPVLFAVVVLWWTTLPIPINSSTTLAFQQHGDPHRIRIQTRPMTTTTTTTTTARTDNTGAAAEAVPTAATTAAAAASVPKNKVVELPPLPKPPFPNGPCGGKVIVIPGLYDDFHPLLVPRDVSVWLPPHYDTTTTSRRNAHDDQQHDHHYRFSVLYCHDGQNVLDDASSWTGVSWRLPGALMRLSERGLLMNKNGGGPATAGGPPPIVVLLPSAEGDVLPGVKRRHLEYGSLGLMTGDGPIPSLAQAHADVVATVIKPYIDRNFCTNPQCASAIGSSMGGQASLNLLLRHPNVFSAAACLSPYFAVDTLAAVALRFWSSSSDRNNNMLLLKSNHRIYLDMGGDVNDVKVPWLDVMDHVNKPKHWWNAGYFWLDTSLQPSCQVMYQLLLQLQSKSQSSFFASGSGGVHERGARERERANNVHFARFPGARHNERAWSHRIHQPLLFLYGKPRNE